TTARRGSAAGGEAGSARAGTTGARRPPGTDVHEARRPGARGSSAPRRRGDGPGDPGPVGVRGGGGRAGRGDGGVDLRAETLSAAVHPLVPGHPPSRSP